MNKSSSNNQMEKRLEILNKITQVEAPNSIYDNVMNRISKKTVDLVPVRWVVIAAALILAFLATDIYLLKSYSQQKESIVSISKMIKTTNNQLYYD